MCNFHSRLIVLLLVIPTSTVRAADPVCESSIQTVKRALDSREIRAGVSVEKMLDIGIPSGRRALGRYVEFHFDIMPTCWGLLIVTKDGVLRRAVEWSCTHTFTYFDGMTPTEEAEYRRLRREFAHVPYEWCLGRWGWARPPRWAWD